MLKQIPWWHPELGENEKIMLAKVIDRQFPNHSIYTVEFEQQVAALCKVPYAVAVTSGTAAIFLSLKAAGVGPGDEVIVPDITFIATAHAVSLSGATPVLVDVRENDLTIDIQAVKNSITPRTKAIIPVHISGRAAQIEQLVKICGDHNLFLIEDAAEALGSSSKGKPLGSFGFTGCFSFTATKLVTTGQGGVIVTHDEEVYYKLRALRDHGRPNRGTGTNDIHDTIGYNFKFTDLQAAVGIAQLETLPRRLEHQKGLYNGYKKYLDGLSKVQLLPFEIQNGESPLWIDAFAENRDELLDFLTENGAETRKFWHPLHHQKPYHTSDTGLTVSVRASQKAFWLPSALSLKEEDVKYVCDLIKQFYKAN